MISVKDKKTIETDILDSSIIGIELSKRVISLLLLYLISISIPMLHFVYFKILRKKTSKAMEV